MEALYKYLITMDPPSREWGYHSDGIKDPDNPGNGQLDASIESGWKGNIDLLIKEKRALMDAFIDAKVPLIVVPYPKENLIDNGWLSTGVEYMRDPSIMSRDGRALVMNMGAPKRKGESDFAKKMYEILGIEAISLLKGTHEGGNTKCIKIGDEWWYFSGTSKRSTQEGIEAAAQFLGGNDQKINHVFLGVESGLHVDCVFTATVGLDDEPTFFAWMDGIKPESRRRIEQVVNALEGDLHEVNEADADALALNGVQMGNHLFASKRFTTPGAQETLEATGLSIHVTPLTQNQHTGGAVHCLTTEIYRHTPLELAVVNERLRSSKLFPPDKEVQIYNNYVWE